MILVDSSVWIDYLRGRRTPQAEKLDALLGSTPLAIGDLILTEVPQGCPTQRQFDQVRELLGTLTGCPEPRLCTGRRPRRWRSSPDSPSG